MAAGRLQAGGVRVIERTPLRLGIPRGTPLSVVLDLLEHDVAILDIRLQTPGLRDAYLTFSQQQRTVDFGASSDEPTA